MCFLQQIIITVVLIAINYFVRCEVADISSTTLPGDVVDLAKKQKYFLETEFKKLTQKEDIQQLYSNFKENGEFTMGSSTASELVRELSDKLSKLLGGKMTALRKAVQFAEDAAANYTWNPYLQPDDLDYINAKRLSSNDSRMVYNPTFLQKVIKNDSSVHIPTEIFEGGRIMINDLAWTNRLDEIFRKIYDNEEEKRNKNSTLTPETRYYFASIHGSLRTFPAMKWSNPPGKVDMYDVRRRPWYTQGSSSPKDMLVMIDTSGSMHGQALRLTKLSVQNLIDTLGENDYMAVGQYPGIIDPHEQDKFGEIKYTVPTDPEGNEIPYYPHLLRYNITHECFTDFVQATKRNKDRLFKLIENVRARGIAYLERAVEFALYMFEKFDKRRNMGARCNRVVMILTDGASENPREVIRTYRAKNNEVFKKVRIFTYAIGQHQNPIQALKELACENKGYFAQIPAIGAVTNKVQDYIPVLQRDFALNVRTLDVKDYPVQTSLLTVKEEGFLRDWQTHERMSQGLGLMTSVTMPVYNRTGNQTLLGVMGTDVTVKDMQDLIPLERLGPNGYAFAMNANGYIVFHPDLRGQRGWLRDPPNVDFLEVEFETAAKKILREEIINCSFANCEPRSVRIETLIKVADEIHTYLRNRTYAYTYINGTNFGVGVVTPVEQSVHPEFYKMRQLLIDVKFEAEDSDLPYQGRNASDFLLWNSRNSEVVLKLRELLSDCAVLVADDMLYCKKYCWTSAPPVPVTEMNYEKAPENKTVKVPLPLTPLPEDAEKQELDAIEDKQQQIEMEKGCGPKKILDLATLLYTLKQNRSICWEHMTSHFFMDLLVVKDHLTKWRATGLQSASSFFLAGNSGATIIYPASMQNYYSAWKSPWKTGYYQRAMDNTNKLLALVPLRSGKPPEIGSRVRNRTMVYNSTHNATYTESVLTPPSTPPDVALFQSVQVPTTKDPHPIAVVGMTLPYQYFADTLFQMNEVCKDPLKYVCYLLDDGGYVIAVNGNSSESLRNIGFFFGYVDPAAMNLLLNLSLYRSVVEYDYQASCKNEPNLYSSASNLVPLLRTLTISILQNVISFTFSVVSYLSSILLYTTQKVQGQEATASSNVNTSCIKLGSRYYFGKIEQASGTAKCNDNCTREMSAKRLELMNLLLVAVQADVVMDPEDPEDSAKKLESDYAEQLIPLDSTKTCTQICAEVPSPPRDPVPNPGPDICTAEPRFRRRPNECYDFDEKEDSVDCGRGTSQSITVNHLLISLLLSVSLLFVTGHHHR